MSTDLYRVRDHVPDYDSWIAQFQARSALSLKAHKHLRNAIYGTGPEDRLDFYFPAGEAKDRPIHLFVHGGYWRAFTKDDFGFVADAIVAAGAIAAIVDYSLLPKARMATPVDQVRRAIAWVHGNAREVGGDPERLTISGHSAGAHLCAMACAAELDAARAVKGALLVSGLYDLAPVAECFVQAEIGLTPEEIESFSPLSLRQDARVRYDIVVGALETAPFHDHSTRMARHLQAQGADIAHGAIGDEHHLSIVGALGTPNTAASLRLAALIAEGGKPT